MYKQAIQLLLNEPSTHEWLEMQRALEQALNKRPVAWDFPIKAAEALGADGEQALPAVAAITCAHMAIILVDDLLDEDPRGAYLRMGAGRAANLAIGLNALGVRIVLGSNSAERERAAAALSEMMGRTAFGQELDVQNAHNEQGYWAVTRAKSSPYFSTALYLGALFSEAGPEVAEPFKQFGEVFGEIMQIHDDLNDCLASPANVDWLQGRSPLPILFAELVEHPDRERFISLRSQAGNAEALQEAQAILVSCGAISYAVHQLMARQKILEELLGEMKLADTAPLQQLLDQAIAPVKHLFAAVDAEFKLAG